MKIIQVVLDLPPSICGVGDFAYNMSGMLGPRGIETRFLVCNPLWQGPYPGRVPPLKIKSMTARAFRDGAENLASGIGRDRGITLLIHYVNYGYGKKGCPFWLVNGIERLKSLGEKYRLITMFHEMYAAGSSWKPAYVFSPIHRYLAKKLSRASDFLITTAEEYARAAKLWSGRDTGTVSLPMPSNVGEPSKISPLSNRKKRMVIFGQQRRAVWRSSSLSERLFRACSTLGLNEIVDIGEDVPGAAHPRHTGITVRRMAPIPATDISLSSILSESFAGYLHYESKFISKSTVYAAYCAHGMLPVFYAEGPATAGLTAGTLFLPARRGENVPGAGRLQEIADNALTQYKTHDTRAWADMISAVVTGKGG